MFIVFDASRRLKFSVGGGTNPHQSPFWIKAHS
jgi:hypothetical protein